jgi:DNA-binding response OmpR family regulator
VSVLLAEHEPGVAEMSARYLRRDGLTVRLAGTPELALAGLTDGPDAVAVLDLTMPGLDPRRIRRALRTPVVFLAAEPRPRGLARGTAGTPAAARRWLGRPFSPRTLVTLVRDVLAEPRARGTAAGTGTNAGTNAGLSAGLTAGPSAGMSAELSADLAGRLTVTEFAVLAALLDRPGRVLSRRQLLTAAGRERASDRAADVYVAQIRAKLGPAVVIRTVRGAGYAMDSGSI